MKVGSASSGASPSVDAENNIFREMIEAIGKTEKPINENSLLKSINASLEFEFLRHRHSWGKVKPHMEKIVRDTSRFIDFLDKYVFADPRGPSVEYTALDLAISEAFNQNRSLIWEQANYQTAHHAITELRDGAKQALEKNSQLAVGAGKESNSYLVIYVKYINTCLSEMGIKTPAISTRDENIRYSLFWTKAIQLCDHFCSTRYAGCNSEQAALEIIKSTLSSHEVKNLGVKGIQK